MHVACWPLRQFEPQTAWAGDYYLFGLDNGYMITIKVCAPEKDLIGFFRWCWLLRGGLAGCSCVSTRDNIALIV